MQTAHSTRDRHAPASPWARVTSRQPTLAAIGFAAAALFAVLLTVNLWLADDPADDAQVLGVTVGPTVEGDPDGEPGTGRPGDVGGGAAIAGLDQGGVDDVAGRGETREVTTEGSSFFSYREDPASAVAGSSTAVAANERGVRLLLTGYADGGRAVIRATVDNATGETLTFPAGLAVQVSIQRDGAPFGTWDLTDPSVTQLLPGRQATLRLHVPLDEFGDYALSGRMVYTPLD